MLWNNISSVVNGSDETHSTVTDVRRGVKQFGQEGGDAITGASAATSRKHVLFEDTDTVEGGGNIVQVDTDFVVDWLFIGRRVLNVRHAMRDHHGFCDESVAQSV